MLSCCTAAVSQSRRRRRRDVTVTCAATSVAVLTVLGLADDVVVAWRRVLNLSTTEEQRNYYTGVPLLVQFFGRHRESQAKTWINSTYM